MKAASGSDMDISDDEGPLTPAESTSHSYVSLATLKSLDR
jgi:hypothetical protein